MSEERKPKSRRKRTGGQGRRRRNANGQAQNADGATENRRRRSRRQSESAGNRPHQNRSRKRQPKRRPQREAGDGKLRILLLGSGGREHALAWKLSQSPRVGRIISIPGSSALGEYGRSASVKPDNFKQNVKQIAQFASRNHIDLTVVGPEIPLAAGIVDEFNRRNLRIFGPTKAAAELEWSKVFAKQFMRRNNIPTASFKVFSDPSPAITFCRTAEYPLVIKADGLAAGKGVLIVDDFAEATDAIHNLMSGKLFGKAGARIVIEEFITGREVSIMAFADGENCWPMPPAQDHKRIGEGDTGPNTGGMGAYTPVPFVDDKLMESIRERVLAPCIKGMAAEGRPYKGVIYAGLMLTESGLKTLEFNCRFGDPETQVVLPLLKSDLAEIMLAIAERKPAGENKKKSAKKKKVNASKTDKNDHEDNNPFDAGPVYLRDLAANYETVDEEQLPEETPTRLQIEWSQEAAATITVASRNYPGKPDTGKKIRGLEDIADEHVLVFHAGVKKQNGAWLTSGGRVLNVTGKGASVAEALQHAYRAVKSISFDGMQFRRDIGHQTLNKETSTQIETAS